MRSLQRRSWKSGKGGAVRSTGEWRDGFGSKLGTQKWMVNTCKYIYIYINTKMYCKY